jgi:transcription-repair coupling factor (superfamily II helicase)
VQLMIFDPLNLRIAHRIDRGLDRAIEIDKSGGEIPIEIIGTDSTVSLALLLTQTQSLEIQQRASLVIVPSQKEAEELERHLCFFGKTENTFILPSFDVSAYSGLYPNSRSISARVRWVHEARAAKPGNIFIATPEALLQRTLPPKVLKAHTLVFKKNDDLPSELARALGRLGYQSVPVVEDEGTFAVRGGIVDIYSPAHGRPVRVELFGDTIESIRFFDPETQRSEGNTDSFSVVPPREILYDDENRARASARFRANVADRPVDPIDRD